MTSQPDRGHVKLLLTIAVLSLCVYASWRGTQWFESHYQNPLTAAVNSGDLQEARRLVEMGADVNENNGAPLMMAVLREGNTKFAQYLLDNGTNINARRPGALSVLEQAAESDRRDLVKWLMERGGEYTLVAAALLGDTETVKQALEKDPALLDRMNSEGYPLLHLVIYREHTELATLLLDLGADPNAPLWSSFASNTYSARRFASIWGREEILALFNKWDSEQALKNTSPDKPSSD